MLHGDLSNKVAPRILVVFEGGLTFPDEDYTDISKLKLNSKVVDRILYLTFKKDLNIEVITWMDEETAEDVTDLLAKNNLPVQGCYSYVPSLLARELSHRLDIMCVYDPDPEHVLLFGSRGMLLTDANQIGE